MRVVCVGVIVCLVTASAWSQDSPPSIFDGQTLNGWTTMDGQPVTRGWEVIDGMIHLPPSEDRSGNIITDHDIGNFILSFDFKISPRGNSGIKYRVRDINGNMLGCEYQVFDDDHPDHVIEPKNSTGSLYDVYEPVADKPLNPAGEWNSAKIVVQDYWIEHWLNGQQILRVLVGSREWYDRIAKSKFNDDPGFGQNRFGRIMLTDHGSEVWYRNFQFEELPTSPEPARMVASCHPSPVSGCYDLGTCQTGLRWTSSPRRRDCRPSRGIRWRR